jgi:hypothetical protein
MARAQAKSHSSNKSSAHKEAPPPAAPSLATVAPARQTISPKTEAPVKAEANIAKEAKETPAEQAAPTSVPTRGGPTQEQISRRAYELFLARGGEHGHQDEDWVRAERELRLGR